MGACFFFFFCAMLADRARKKDKHTEKIGASEKRDTTQRENAMGLTSGNKGALAFFFFLSLSLSLSHLDWLPKSYIVSSGEKIARKKTRIYTAYKNTENKMTLRSALR